MGLDSCRVGPPDVKWELFSQAYSFRTGSLIYALTKFDSIVVTWLGEGPALASVVAGGGQECTYHTMTTGPTLPPVSVINGMERGEHV